MQPISSLPPRHQYAYLRAHGALEVRSAAPPMDADAIAHAEQELEKRAARCADMIDEAMGNAQPLNAAELKAALEKRWNARANPPQSEPESLPPAAKAAYAHLHGEALRTEPLRRKAFAESVVQRETGAMEQCYAVIERGRTGVENRPSRLRRAESLAGIVHAMENNAATEEEFAFFHAPERSTRAWPDRTPFDLPYEMLRKRTAAAAQYAEPAPGEVHPRLVAALDMLAALPVDERLVRLHDYQNAADPEYVFSDADHAAITRAIVDAQNDHHDAAVEESLSSAQSDSSASASSRSNSPTEPRRAPTERRAMSRLRRGGRLKVRFDDETEQIFSLPQLARVHSRHATNATGDAWPEINFARFAERPLSIFRHDNGLVSLRFASEPATVSVITEGELRGGFGHGSASEAPPPLLPDTAPRLPDGFANEREVREIRREGNRLTLTLANGAQHVTSLRHYQSDHVAPRGNMTRAQIRSDERTIVRSAHCHPDGLFSIHTYDGDFYVVSPRTFAERYAAVRGRSRAVRSQFPSSAAASYVD